LPPKLPVWSKMKTIVIWCLELGILYFAIGI
jgi:hypothetical protein